MDSFSFAPTFWQWWILGLVLVIVEVFAPGAFLIWIGIAAGVVGLLVLLLPGFPWQFQVLTFGVLSVAIVLLWRRYLQAHPVHSEAPTLNRRGEQYVGRVFTLDEPIINGIGKLRVDDSIWRITGVDCPAQSKVVITGVDGVVLRVGPQDESAVPG